MMLRWVWARFDDLGVHALHDALALRCKVFILEQGPYQDPDGADKQSYHLLGYDEAGELEATAQGLARAPASTTKPLSEQLERSGSVARATGLVAVLAAVGIALWSRWRR
jgi:predicted GNAT family N-acyltransferase